MAKRKDEYMELFQRLRRDQQEIEKERQELAEAYASPLKVSPKPKRLSPRRKPKKVPASRRSPSTSGIKTKTAAAKTGPQRGQHRHDPHQTLLKDALSDLEKELRSLRAARRQLELEMEETVGMLGSAQSKEISLRNKISELMKKETALEEKRSSLKDKLSEVAKKIEKVRTIESQLKDM